MAASGMEGLPASTSAPPAAGKAGKGPTGGKKKPKAKKKKPKAQPEPAPDPGSAPPGQVNGPQEDAPKGDAKAKKKKVRREGLLPRCRRGADDTPEKGRR